MANPVASTDREQGPPLVEVIYATANDQRVICLEHSSGLTAIEAVRRSGLLLENPEISPLQLVLGIFGEQVAEDKPLLPGDRVEICRPLEQDPRDMRSGLAAAGESMGRSRKPSES
jgi:putative ubiquitin-RnfH superfamily antitoxin RatB of RatAB toxin-antitoxin module